MKNIITVSRVVHRYGEHLALDGLSFEVGRGEVFGLLGPNGAGKTTTIRLANGLMRPQSGEMRVLGFDPCQQGAEIRQRSGVLTETPALYERLTAVQNLEFFGTLADMQPEDLQGRIHELLGFFELSDRAGDCISSYSKGMKQRLALARALLTKPELLFLDEPTSGLDPEAAKQVHDLIQDVRHHNGQTVVLCTHHLYEAERLCDRLAVMSRGQILAAGSLQELRAQAAPELRVRFSFGVPLDATQYERLAHSAGILNCSKPENHHVLVQVSEEAVIPQLISTLVQSGVQIVAVEPQLASLEEIYFRLQQHAEEVRK
jgi:ABC-2 type transport system ATP-binding protein